MQEKKEDIVNQSKPRNRRRNQVLIGAPATENSEGIEGTLRTLPGGNNAIRIGRMQSA